MGSPQRNTNKNGEEPYLDYFRYIGEYADRMGKQAVEKHYWRLACFLLVAINLIAIGGLIYINTQSQIVPYIVQVDSKTGAVLNVADSTAKQEITDREIAYFLWEVVKKSRTLPKDIVIYQNNWRSIYSFLSDETATKMNEFAVLSEHEEKLNTGITTQLEMKSFMVTQDDVYQIRWQEIIYEPTGKIMSTVNMEGLFTVKQGKVSKDNAYLNPLGLIIVDFNWSQER